jgi:VWFA-related protein
MRHDAVLARAIAIGAIAVAPVVHAQQQPPPAPRPAFRVGVDVVLVDVSVLDASGQPVHDLQPQDFQVRVDGRPRKTLAADLVEYRAAAGGTPAVSVPLDYSTNEGIDAGRVVLIVVDLPSFLPGEERRAVAAAAKFLETLAPGDRVGVATVPAGGGSLDFTSDLARARTVLGGMVGTRDDQTGIVRLGIAESLRIVRGDRLAWRELVTRECSAEATQLSPFAPSTGCAQPGYEPECPCSIQDRLRSEVRSFVNVIRQQANRRMGGLLDLLRALRGFQGPKLVAFVSQGVVVDELSFSRDALAAMAGLAGAQVHVLQVESAAYDPASRERPRERLDDQRLVRNGLSDLAHAVGGGVYRAIGDIDHQIARLWRETAAVWRVAVEPDGADLDGKPHGLDVKVARAGATVRARSHFIVDAAARALETPAGRLRDAVVSPVSALGLPVRVTHFVSPAPAGDHAIVRVVGEVEGGSGGEAPQALFVVFDDRGHQVAAGSGTLAEDPAEHGSFQFSARFTAGPGRYTVRVAAVSGDGRVGSVERRLEIAAPRAGDPAFGDLILAELRADAGSDVSPSVRPVVTNGRLAAYVELAPPSGAAPADAHVAIEVAASPGEAPIVAVPAAIRPSPSGSTATASALVAVGALDEGDYVARAVGTWGETTAASGWRAFRVAASRAVAPATASGAVGSTRVAGGGVRPVGPLPPIVPAFDRRVVLGGDLMQRVLSELGDRPSAADPAVAGALRDAESGRFPLAGGAGGPAAADPATAAMLRGLGLLATGRLDEAAGAFKTAIGESPDLSLALVYVGACYAAGGRDREAAGAWQTALIEERDVAPLYLLLTDAWLRLGENERAVAVLDRAAARWPARLDVKRRRAIARAAAGRWSDALGEIASAMAAAPGDVETACLGFRLDREDPDVRDAGSLDRTRALARGCAAGDAPESALAADWLREREGARP